MKTVEEHCSLASSGSCLATFFTQPRTTFLENGAAYSGLDPSSSIDSQDNLPHTCLQTNVIQAIPVEFPFLDDTRP